MSPSASFLRDRGAFLLVLAFAFAVPRLEAQSVDAAGIRANAIALEQRGDNDKAEQAWQALAKADPRNAEALAHLGLLEARQERLEKAIGFYRQAIAIDPDLPGLQMNLGLALFKAAQFPGAIQMFASEIKKHPGDQRLTILLGMSHFGLRDYFVAIPYLRRAADRDPQNLTLRMALARSCLMSKQYQCVIDVHREIEAVNQNVAEADVLAAEALDAQQDHEGAVSQLRAAIQANAEEANVHFALGYLLWTKGQWAEAARELEAELQHYPQNIQARIFLADAQVQQGDFATPLADLKKLVARNPSEPLVHIDLGTIAARNGHTEDALRELRIAAQGASENSEVHMRIAEQFESMERTEEAQLERERAGGIPQRGYASLLDVLESSD
ncbi:MAG TPA: tetratricopeptide repeat protein [Terracidiphilus sp.]|nr:tetratricopeptide repeat protein [Terracidiphilus sp.]